MSQVKRLHLGCGYKTPAGWINVDGSWNARLAKYPAVRQFVRRLRVLPNLLLDMPWSPDVLVHDVRMPLPFPDNSMSVIYASHLMEHLYPNEARRLLGECFRVLEPGGVLRVVVPDLHAIILEYLGEGLIGDSTDSIHAFNRADRLNRRLLMREPDPGSANAFHRIYTALTDFHSHKWMYDVESLTAFVQAEGFVDVQERGFLESLIRGIEEVEEAGRILDGAGICVEGTKPPVNTQSVTSVESQTGDERPMPVVNLSGLSARSRLGTLLRLPLRLIPG